MEDTTAEKGLLLLKDSSCRNGVEIHNKYIEV